MPQGYSPAVFVSSTCYDLSQVRSNIKSFLESLGLDAVLSEFNTFPVNPDVTTLQSCLDSLDQRADIMLLLVGNRYGFQINDGKSITNLEYLRAKAKGIPIYIFVLKSILSTLPVWEQNPNADFTNIVDNPKLFEFVESLQGSKDHWVFPFELAEDIINTLRFQFSYLFMDALALRQKISGYGLGASLQNLKGDALRILIERPLGWEYLLFSHVLLNEIHSCKDLRYDLQYGISIGTHKYIGNPIEVMEWLGSRIKELMAISNGLDALMNNALKQAFGAPGESGNPEHIVYVAQRVVAAYKEAIKWAIDFNRVNVPDDFQRLISLASAMPLNMINEIEKYAESLHSGLHSALENATQNVMPIKLEFILTLTVPDFSDLNAELKKVSRKYGLDSE